MRNQIKKDSFLRYLPLVVDLEQSSPKTSAFESLKSLGLEILTNDILRQAIATLYQIMLPRLTHLDAVMEAFNFRNKIVRLIEPHIVLNRAGILQLINTDEYGSPGGFQFIDIVDFGRLVNDESLLLTIHQSLSRRKQVIRHHQRVLDPVLRVINMISEKNEWLE